MEPTTHRLSDGRPSFYVIWGIFFMSSKIIKVRCYLDYLNFYYGIACPCNYKWIDYESLFKDLILRTLRENKNEVSIEIEKFLVFSTPLFGTGSSARQATYLSALKIHSSCIEVMKLSKMQKAQKKGYIKDISLTDKNLKKIAFVPKVSGVVKTLEEKKTDVNIAVRIVKDAYTDEHKKFDFACLISNDSDLEAPLIVKKELRQKFILVAPILLSDKDNNRRPSASLTKHVKSRKYVISGIDHSLVLSHKLPPKIDKYTAPDYPGWR